MRGVGHVMGVCVVRLWVEDRGCARGSGVRVDNEAGDLWGRAVEIHGACMGRGYIGCGIGWQAWLLQRGGGRFNRGAVVHSHSMLRGRTRPKAKATSPASRSRSQMHTAMPLLHRLRADACRRPNLALRFPPEDRVVIAVVPVGPTVREDSEAGGVDGLTPRRS